MDERKESIRDTLAWIIINFTIRHIATERYADHIRGIINQGIGAVYGEDAYKDWVSRQR